MTSHHVSTALQDRGGSLPVAPDRLGARVSRPSLNDPLRAEISKRHGTQLRSLTPFSASCSDRVGPRVYGTAPGQINRRWDMAASAAFRTFCPRLLPPGHRITGPERCRQVESKAWQPFSDKTQPGRSRHPDRSQTSGSSSPGAGPRGPPGGYAMGV